MVGAVDGHIVDVRPLNGRINAITEQTAAVTEGLGDVLTRLRGHVEDKSGDQ